MIVSPEEEPTLKSISKIVVNYAGVGKIDYIKGNPDPNSFLEYDFSFIVNKYTENQFLVDEIDNYTKNIGWRSIFPTANEVEEDSTRFFGYLGNIYFLEIGPNSREVEVYEKEDQENPSFTIDFNEGSEKKFWKFFYIYISSDNVASVNLSYDAWRIDKNPYRNRNQFVLRNDTYRDYEINPVNESGFDKRSGTIIGQATENTTPILNKKLQSLDYTQYSPKRVYKSGERTNYNDKTYISISDHNIGNYPQISKEWITVIDLSFCDIFGESQNTRETANSYVINRPGYYKFPLVYGNAISNDNPNAKSYTNVGGEYQADFVNYLGNIITSPYIEVDTGTAATKAELLISDEDEIIDDIKVENGYLFFRVTQVPNCGANAVIGIYNSDNTIMWSWHIWLWRESLKPVTIENYSGNEYQILPVNLASKYDEDGVHLINWHYQWGRKDPMLCPASYDSNSDHTSFGTTSFTIANPAEFVSDAIKNPCTFYKKVNNYKNNWVQLNYFYNFWDATCNATGFTEKTIVKTVYDPCPRGYSIPNARVFTGFTTTGNNTTITSQFNVIGSWNRGWNFKTADGGSVFFPATGYRGNSNGSLYGVGSLSYCWSAGAAKESGASLLTFSSSYVSPLLDYINRSFVCSVRPCKIQ